MKTSILLGTLTSLLLVSTPQMTLAESVSGGVLNIATVGEPPTLDFMLNPTDIVAIIGHHIFETLYAFDANWQPQPLLAAAMPVISADGLTYTIALRPGITFHDGTPMTATDVVASLQRWMLVNSKGKQVAPMVAALTETNDLTVTITLTTRYAPLVAMLSAESVIMPSEKLAEPLTEFVGTGPYQLKERRPDQYIQLVRFENYVSPEGEPSNYAGHREAVADELHFVPVPDANTRVEGLLAGQYDFADSLPFGAYDRIAASDKAAPVILEPNGWTSINMNMKQGVMSNKTLRHAVQLALNADDLMAAAFDDPKFYSIDGAYYPEGNFWHTTAGIARYGQGDSEGAAALLAEAGYDGTPIRLLTSRQYEFHYKLAQVAQVYLEAAGFKVELMVTDWATLTTKRAEPGAWDMFITHTPFPANPGMLSVISDAYPGWYVSDQKDVARAGYLASVTPEEQQAAWAQLQIALYEDAPLFKVGNFNALSGVNQRLENYTPTYWPHFWNVKVTQ